MGCNIFFAESCNNILTNCYNNTFGYYCDGNILKAFGDGNTFGNDCCNNTFGVDCCGNTFGNDCCDNSFGNYCYYNTFGNDCRGNVFVSDCNDNTFGNNYRDNTFGSSCYCNIFTTTRQELIHFVTRIKFNSGCSYIKLLNTSTGDDSNLVQDITIEQGVTGQIDKYLELQVQRNAAPVVYEAANTKHIILD